MAMTATNAQLADEARRILGEAARRGATLRASGGVAIYLRTSRRELFERLGRTPMRDIDLVGLSSERREMRATFDALGYQADPDLLISGEGVRFGFWRATEPRIDVDVFIDRLPMCHTLELKGRLAAHDETLALADLLLQKLQIVDLTPKDAIDAVVLLLEHDITAGDADAIDIGYISRLLAADWGFYHTVTLNTDRVTEQAEKLALTPAERHRVRTTLQGLREAIDDEPKSRRWKLRARVGTKRRWYQDVEDATGAF
jgi:hypothetical protein